MDQSADIVRDLQVDSAQMPRQPPVAIGIDGLAVAREEFEKAHGEERLAIGPAVKDFREFAREFVRVESFVEQTADFILAQHPQRDFVALLVSLNFGLAVLERMVPI